MKLVVAIAASFHTKKMVSEMYDVGQVLYAIFPKENKVVPLLVCEQITKKTLSGVEIVYKFMMGTSAVMSTDITSEMAELHVSAEDAKRSLITRMTSTIDKLIATAEAKAASWYSAQTQQTPQ